LELPFIYRSDDDGNVNMVDNVKQVRAVFPPTKLTISTLVPARVSNC